jgi:DNA-binding IclR family transcriptional regulator
MDVSMEQRAMEISVNQGFDRLQRILTTMNVGDDISPAAAAEQTGLSEDVCRAMLNGLERAGLMTRESDERFTRCTLDLLKT